MRSILNLTYLTQYRLLSVASVLLLVLGGNSMPRPGWRKQPDESRLTDNISIGVLTKTFAKDLIDEILSSRSYL